MRNSCSLKAVALLTAALVAVLSHGTSDAKSLPSFAASFPGMRIDRNNVLDFSGSSKLAESDLICKESTVKAVAFLRGGAIVEDELELGESESDDEYDSEDDIDTDFDTSDDALGAEDEGRKIYVVRWKELAIAEDVIEIYFGAFDDNKQDTEFEEMDFDETNWIDSDAIVSEYQRMPPVTKAHITATVAIAFMGVVFKQPNFPMVLCLDWTKILKCGQVWRLLTPFFDFGPLGISFFINVREVWIFMSDLERVYHQAPYEFWTMVAFGMTTIAMGHPLLKLNPHFLSHSFISYLVYIWSRNFEGRLVRVLGFLELKAEMLPWFVLLEIFLLQGKPPIRAIMGIILGHAFFYLKKIGVLRSPKYVKNWYESSKKPFLIAVRKKYEEIGSGF